MKIQFGRVAPIMLWLLFEFAGVLVVQAQTTFFSRASGGWTSNSTWDCGAVGNPCATGVYPGSGSSSDIVNIGNNTVTLTSTATVASITLASSGTSSSVLDVSGTMTLTAGSVTVSTSGTTDIADFVLSNQGTGNPTVHVTGDVNFTRANSSTGPGARLKMGGTSTVTNSTFTVDGNFTYNFKKGGDETDVEMSIGNSSTVNDACTLVVKNTLTLLYSFHNDVINSDVINVMIGNSSKVQAGDLITQGKSGSAVPQAQVALESSNALLDVGASVTSGTGTFSIFSNGVDGLTLELGSSTSTGAITAKKVALTDNAVVLLHGANGHQMNITSSSSDALSIAGPTSIADFLIYGNTNVNITGGITMTRNANHNLRIRLRIGGSSSTTTSIVSVGGNLSFDYLGTSSNETYPEIFVGGSLNDVCSLAISGNVSLTYNYNSKNTQSNNSLDFLVGFGASVAMNNLTMNLINGGNGTGSNIVVSTSDAYGASITINGDLSMTSSSTNAQCSNYLKVGYDQSGAFTNVLIKGNLNMTSTASSGTGTINNYVRVSGVSTLTTGTSAGLGDIKFSASAANSENRITLNERGTLNMYGTITNQSQGSFDFKPTGSNNPNSSTPNNTLGFYGTSNNAAQVFPLNFASSVYPNNNYKNIVLNNTSGTPITIPASQACLENYLTLTSGIIASTTTGKFVFEDASNCSVGNSSSYITGPVMKRYGNGNTDLIFPIGSGSVFAPLSFSSPSGVDATTTVTAQYFPSRYPTTTTDGTFDHISQVEYWDLAVAGTKPSSAALGLYWSDACRSGITNISNVNTSSQDLMIGHFNGTNWNKFTYVTRGNYTITGAICPSGGSGSIKEFGLQAADFTSGTAFTFVALNAYPAGNILPIILDKFWGEQVGGQVKLGWTVSAEVNCAYYIVMHSTDGVNFRSVDTIRASGTSAERRYYEVWDNAPKVGNNYYRLAEVDLDGANQTFKTILVSATKSSELSIELFPNPVSNGQLNIAMSSGVGEEPLSIGVYSVMGNEVTSKCRFKYAANGMFQGDVHLLAPGIYFLKCSASGLSKSIRFVVE